MPIAFALLPAVVLAATGPQVMRGSQDHENPTLRRVETSYRCRDGDRSFTLVYGQQGPPLIESAVRRGAALPPEQLQAANLAIGRMSGVSSVTPQCSEANDMLIVVGVVGQQRSAVFLGWSDSAIQATRPEPIGF